MSAVIRRVPLYRSLYLFSDVFRSGIWREIDEGVPELQRLLTDMPGVLASARESSTVRGYNKHFDNWTAWCTRLGLKHLPGSSVHIALYLLHVLQTSASWRVVSAAFYGIRWVHYLTGASKPFRSTVPRLVVDAARRLLPTRVLRKRPITCKMIRRMRFVHIDNTLPNLRLLAITVLSYSGFLRFAELVALKRSDIRFKHTHLCVTIRKSKTDVYRDGHTLVIARTGSDICPYGLLKRYLKVAKIDSHSHAYIFRGVCKGHGKSQYCLRTGNTPLSYTRVREIVLSGLRKIGVDTTQYGLHSLRSGGATAAARAGISDRLFKRHGRWRSETAKDGYVQDKLSTRLVVTQNLGL